VRDVHDLFVFSTKVWNRSLLRRLVVIKLWQVRDPFDPAALFDRLEQDEYDWEDLKRLLRNKDKIDPKKIISQCVASYSFLRELTEEERALAADAKAHKELELWKELVALCREEDESASG
jgi:hypothetical protein